MAGQRIYGVSAGQIVTTGSNGAVAVTWARPFLEVPVVELTVENDSDKLGAFADVLKGSVTRTGCTVRAWRTQMLTTVLLSVGSSPVLPYAGAVIHVRPNGTLA